MTEAKQAYFQKLYKLFEECPKAILVGTDNVGSSHMQKMRQTLRGQAHMLMGKNTMIRKAIRSNLTKMPQLAVLLPHIRGNIGFIFVPPSGELTEIKKKISELRVEAPARAGAIAPCDVTVPAGPTGMEPTQTSFLQALNIASKIVKGQVEIISDVALIKKGEKVLPGQAALLAKLSINPFTYGLEPVAVYDQGSVYSPSFLEYSDADLLVRVGDVARNIAGLSMELGLANTATIPSMILNGFTNLLAIAYECPGVNFKEADEFKKNAAAAAAAAPAATPAPAAAKGGKKEEPKKEEPKKKEPEPEPEADDDMGFGLFD